MVWYIPFVYQAFFFSTFNAVGSLHAWYMTQRHMMLVSGSLNSSIGAVAVYTHSFDPTLSNACTSIASISAFGHFGLHAFRTKALLRPSAMSFLHFCWCISLLAFGIHRGRWAYTLRHD